MQEEAVVMHRNRGLAARFRLPNPIDLDLLYRSDVDKNIWADAAFDWEQANSPPRWMVDDNMKRAINGMLLHERCEEEKERIDMEVGTMRLWLDERRDKLGHALEVFKGT